MIKKVDNESQLVYKGMERQGIFNWEYKRKNARCDRVFVITFDFPSDFEVKASNNSYFSEPRYKSITKILYHARYPLYQVFIL